MAIANAKFSYSGVNLPSIKEPLGTGIKNTGRHVTYVGGVDIGVGTNFDFSSTVSCTGIQKINADVVPTVSCTGIQATTQSTLTVGTTSALINFGPGDVLHDEDDRLLGTVKTVNSATEMTMVDNLANATVNAKKVYNLNPIVLQLTFGATASI